MFPPLVVTELVGAIKRPRTTPAPRNEAGVLRDTMLLLMSGQVTQAGEDFSTSSVTAGMRVGIDVGTSRYRPAGNGMRHCRGSEHASSMRRQYRGGRHAGSGRKRQPI